MKLTETLNEALNSQCTHEMQNVLLYSQIASYFEDMQLKNIAEYFKKQANEEMGHFQKFMQYINDRIGGKVTVETPSAIPVAETIGAIAEMYVKREQETTESIEGIYELALEEKSFMDLEFISGMLREQVEEEDNATEFAKKLTSVCDLVLFDATLG